MTSGYDQLFVDLRRFRQELGDLNERIRDSRRTLAERHDAVDGIWNDSFRSEYDARYRDLVEPTDSYVGREAEQFERFLDRQLQALDRYLRGG